MHHPQSTGGAPAQPSANLTSERATETSYQARPAALWRGFVQPQQQALAGLGGVQTELPGADRHRVEPEPEEPARFAGPVRSPDARQVGLLEGASSNPHKHRPQRGVEEPESALSFGVGEKPGGSGGSAAPPRCERPACAFPCRGCGGCRPTDRPIVAPPVHPIQKCLPFDQQDAGRLTRAGVDIVGLAIEAGAYERARALEWVAGLRTKPTKANPEGKLRSWRVKDCGRLYAAMSESQGDMRWGAQPRSCHDRACPSCMRARSARLAKLLRLWLEPLMEKASVDFVTLTGIKLELEHESAAGAADRMFAAWAELVNKKTAGGRMLRTFYPNGLRAFEEVMSHKGKVRKDGSRVAYSGWHAHIHALMELAPLDADALRRVVAWLERRAKRRDVALLLVRALRVQACLLGERYEAAAVEWGELAREFLLWRWLDLNPEASWAAQCVEPADLHRCGQLTKYLTKPFELRSPSLARELFVALEGRRCLQGFGAWLSWVKAAEEASAVEDDEPGIRVSLTPMREIWDAIDRGDRSVVLRFHDRDIAVDPQLIEAGIKACRGSFRSLAKRQRIIEGEEEPSPRAFLQYTETAGILVACGLLPPQRGSPVGGHANLSAGDLTDDAA